MQKEGPNDDPNGVYARYLGLLHSAPGLFVVELVDTRRIVVTKNVEFLSKSQETLTNDFSQLYSSEARNLPEECQPDADGGIPSTIPTVPPDPSIELWKPWFSPLQNNDVIRHANEFDPIAYANATGEYKQAGGPRPTLGSSIAKPSGCPPFGYFGHRRRRLQLPHSRSRK